MGAGKADPLDARDLMDGFEQAAEVARRVVRGTVMIDDLPEQLDLAATAVSRLANLGEDVALGPHPLMAARVRHDAKAAELIAAFDDRHVGLQRVGPPRHPQGKRDIVVGIEVDDRLARRRGLFDQHRQPADRLRADDHIGDALRALEDFRAFLLRHATGNGDDGMVALFDTHLPQLAEARVQLLLRALADAAGVDHHQIGVDGLVCGFEPCLLQQAGHPLRVVDVHLAAERLDQVFTRHSVSTLPLSALCLLCVPWDFRLSPFRFRPRDRRVWPLASHARTGAGHR